MGKDAKVDDDRPKGTKTAVKIDGSRTKGEKKAAEKKKAPKLDRPHEKICLERNDLDVVAIGSEDHQNIEAEARKQTASVLLEARPSWPDDPASLVTDAEWAILRVLWDRGPLRMGEIIAELQQTRTWSRTTITTLANRLEKKGAVGTDRQNKAYIYIPLISEKKARREKLRHLIDTQFDGKAYDLLKILHDDGWIEEEDLQRLKGRGKKKRKNKGK